MDLRRVFHMVASMVDSMVVLKVVSKADQKDGMKAVKWVHNSAVPWDLWVEK